MDFNLPNSLNYAENSKKGIEMPNIVMLPLYTSLKFVRSSVLRAKVLCNRI